MGDEYIHMHKSASFTAELTFYSGILFQLPSSAPRFPALITHPGQEQQPAAPGHGPVFLLHLRLKSHSPSSCPKFWVA